MAKGRVQYLKSRFERGWVYLVYDGDHVRLANSEEMLGLRDGPIFHIHLAKQHDDFMAAYSDSPDFSPPRIQALAGITYRQLNTWIERGLLNPIDRQGKTRSFSSYDAFIAKIIGLFRMQGASMDVVEKLARFLSTNPEPKRA